MPALSTETAVWFLNQLVVIAVLTSAFYRKLTIPYRCFCYYLAVQAVVSAALSYFHSIQPDSSVYAKIYYFWAYSAPIFYFFAISEVLHSTLSPFPALERASRSILRFLWIGLAGFGALWYLYLRNNSSVPYPNIQASLSYQQASATSFALFMLLFLALVTFMPVPMSRMKMIHCFLLGGIFFFMALSRLISLFNDFNWARHAGSLLGMAGSILVLSLWALLMRPESLDAPLRIARGQIDIAQAEAYFARLRELNQTLARSGPRFFR